MKINATGYTTEGIFSQTGSGFSPVPHEGVPVNTQYTEYTQYRVPVSLPVLQNVSLPVSQNVVVHQPPQTEGMIRGSVFSPIPQTAGHSVSLPVIHNAIGQHVPQNLVQVSQTEGTAVQQIP